MIFENTDVEFTYPSPERSSPPVTRDRVVSRTQESTNRARGLPQTPSTAHELAHQRNPGVTVEVRIPSVRAPSQVNTPTRPPSQVNTPKRPPSQTSTHSQPPSSKPTSTVQVIIPSLSSDFRPNDYSFTQPAITAMATQVQPRVRPQNENIQTHQDRVQPSPTRKPSTSKIQPPAHTAHQAKPLPPAVLAQAVIPPGSNPALRVEIPTPSNFRPEEYVNVTVPDSPDTPQHLSRKRRRSDMEDSDDVLASDQREKADMVIQALRDYMQEIFEAQNYFDPGNSQPSKIFTTTNDGYSLSVVSQTKIEKLIQQTISACRYQQVPSDELLLLQKLCEEALKDAETINIKISDDIIDIPLWQNQLITVELGLRSARTILALMTGGHEDKQLYSEDMIQSCLNAFKNVTETCLVPIAELRNSGTSSTLFKLLLPAKKELVALLSQCRRLLITLESLVAKIDLTETVMITLESAASNLIFVENAQFDKDSILGISYFENFRSAAMGVLAQIFLLSNPEQRRATLNEILSSLAKLPITKQSARQYKLTDGGSIQLVSALIMLLIQTSATKTDDGKAARRRRALQKFGDEDGVAEPPDVANHTEPSLITSEHRAEQQPVTAIQELGGVVGPLWDRTALANANYVMSFIIHQAKDSSKSSDSPYRNLLNLFIEDFIKCLASIDWPAAELLLRVTTLRMLTTLKDEKSSAPAKAMALDLLGVMGAAISELNKHSRSAARLLENGDGELGKYLSRLAEASLDKKASEVDIVSWKCGPYRVCLEFLEELATKETQSRSAIGFLMAKWGHMVNVSFDKIPDDEDDHVQIEKDYGRLAYRLRMMICDKKWLTTEYVFEPVSPVNARLAYSITLMHSEFCAMLGHVLNSLVDNMASDQITVCSKALRMITQVLDTDPTILDSEPIIIQRVVGCLEHGSSLVRDAALSLVGKCIELQHSLEEQMLPQILLRAGDSGVGVRKRALKLSKDIYLRNKDIGIRSGIAATLLSRISDLDEGVQELSRQMVYDIWMKPLHAVTKSDDLSPQSKLAIAEHASLIVKTMQFNNVSEVLHKVLHIFLTPQVKKTAPTADLVAPLSKKSTYSFDTGANLNVCKALVTALFDAVIDNSLEGSTAPSRRDALVALEIFAKAEPTLFQHDKIKLLQPYVSNLTQTDEPRVYRSVLIIFRYVLPHLTTHDEQFLKEVRMELLQASQRVRLRHTLDDLFACLWTISEVLKDFRNLTTLVISALTMVKGFHTPEMMELLKKDDAAVSTAGVKFFRILPMVGMLGKHCDFEPHRDVIKDKFPKLKNSPVSRLIVETLSPFSFPEWPLNARSAAMEAIGLVCQTWPTNFTNPNVLESFLQAFQEKNRTLEAMILGAFKDFLALEEKRSESSSEDLPGAATDPTAKLGVMGGSQSDGVALRIANKDFLDPIIVIALSQQDDLALLATEVIASIARQGLVHPKEIGLTLIALETSTNSKIAELALKEHHAFHEKHETILEREYLPAVRRAYEYQRDVVKDDRGATTNPFTSKLFRMLEVLKISKTKNRKRFYDKLCAQVEIAPSKMDDVIDHLKYSRFIIQNLAFFEYHTVDELLSTITTMEKVVAAAGTGIAHSIETEIFNISLDQPSQTGQNGEMNFIESSVSPDRLQQLTATSVVLSALWEARTHLRRQYGLMKTRADGKAKAVAKDVNRVPTKAQGVNGDKFWSEVTTIFRSNHTHELAKQQCQRFVELMSIDSEVKIAAEDDDDPEGLRLKTPSDEEDNGTPGPPGSGRGRKRKATGTPGGRKKRARSSSVGLKARG